MEKKYAMAIVFGIIICAILFFIDIYLGAIGVVVLGVLVMSMLIMQETREICDVRAYLKADAKGVIIKNHGNVTAYKIHVAIVPLNVEFNVASLEPDTSFESAFEAMVNEAKAVVEFQDSHGTRITRTFALSALGKSEDDLLKPMFPIFGYK